MVVTVAMRMPARMVRAASGISTRHKNWRPVIPMAMADSRTAASTPRMPDQRIAQNRQQRVEHQRHDGGALADAADQRHGNQKAEQRQAGDGLHHVGESQHPGTPCGAARDQNAGGDGQADGDGHRDQHQRQMLERELADLAWPDLSSLRVRLPIEALQEGARLAAAGVQELSRRGQQFERAIAQQGDARWPASALRAHRA